MPLDVENIRLFKSGYKCCSILRTFWTVFKPWDGLARTMTVESIKRTQGQWTVMVLWLCSRSSRKCTSASFYMTSLVTNCKRFFTESRVHRAGTLGTWQWHSAHPMLAALADAAPSVCTRAAVEEASVTATANSLGWPVSWASTQSGGGDSKVMKIGSHSPQRKGWKWNSKTEESRPWLRTRLAITGHGGIANRLLGPLATHMCMDTHKINKIF